MKSLIGAMSALLLVLSGCHHHPQAGHAPPHSGHPHGGAPGQVKKMYRCGHCGATNGSAVSCHGKVMIVFD